MGTPGKKPPALVVLAEHERAPLVRILVAEGQAANITEFDQALIDAGVVAEIQELGYYEVAEAVVGPGGYKVAARLVDRKDGVNVNQDSLDMFRAFSQRSRGFAEDMDRSLIARALALHNAASALSRGNGNLPDEQLRLNQEAIKLLEQVHVPERDDDWWEAYRKPMVGLMEAGHIPLNVPLFIQMTRHMVRNGSKDAPGRVKFLLTLFTDVAELAHVVLDQGLGAPNQRDDLQAMVDQLSELLKKAA